MMTIKNRGTSGEIDWDKTDDAEWGDRPQPASRLRMILQRAGWMYLSLFLGLSLLMSIAGVDPLTQDGALPKCLFVFVGLAVILAAGRSDASLVDEQARSWLALGRYRALKPHSPQTRKRF
jgi:hypothetical protein